MNVRNLQSLIVFLVLLCATTRVGLGEEMAGVGCEDCTEQYRVRLNFLYTMGGGATGNEEATTPTLVPSGEDYLERAYVYHQLSQPEMALIDAQEAESRMPGSARPYPLLARLHTILGSDDLATSYTLAAGIASQSDPVVQYSTSLYYYHRALAQRRDYNPSWWSTMQTARDFGDHLATLLSHREVSLLRAKIDVALGNEVLALEKLSTVISECDCPLIVLVEAAFLNYGEGDLNAAIDLLEKAIKRQALMEMDVLCNSTEPVLIEEPIGFPPEWRYILASYMKENANSAWAIEAKKTIADIDRHRAVTKDSAVLSALRAKTALLLEDDLRARADALHAASIEGLPSPSSMTTSQILAAILPE